jgi:hypothetical protein
MSLLFRVILIGKSVILIDPTASVMWSTACVNACVSLLAILVVSKKLLIFEVSPIDFPFNSMIDMIAPEQQNGQPSCSYT